MSGVQTTRTFATSEIADPDGRIDKNVTHSPSIHLNLDYSSAVINKAYKHFHNTDIIH